MYIRYYFTNSCLIVLYRFAFFIMDNSTIKGFTDQRKPLQRMFNNVPRRYDRMNRILTWYMDERWRKKATKECLDNNPKHILDLCTGTGDLALQLGKTTNGKTKITALDFSLPMLEIAQRKAVIKRMSHIRFVEGDVSDLPFKDKQFDSIGIAFAFRNLTFKNPKTQQYLREINRVISENGRLVIIESSQPKNKILKKLYHLYLKNIVGRIGGILSGHKSAYRYLAYSAINYFSPEEIAALLKEYGFNRVEHKQFYFGVACMHVAYKN